MSNTQEIISALTLGLVHDIAETAKKEISVYRRQVEILELELGKYTQTHELGKQVREEK